MTIRFPFRKDGFPRQRARADRVVRPYDGGKECAKWEVEDGVLYEEVYGDTAVRCGRNQLGGGA